MRQIRKSTRKHKKYDAYYKGKWVSFGDSRYTQYKDCALGLYSHKDHLDKKRRVRFLQRMGGAKTKAQALANSKVGTPRYYSIKFLW